MTSRKSRSDSEYELYVQRFNSMGLELPEAATANPASMRHVATFLMKHGVFGDDEPQKEGENAFQDVGSSRDQE